MGEHPPAWHPDPLGRYDHRWWDGAQWTDQVSQGGQAMVDPKGTEPSDVPTTPDLPERIQKQVQQQAGLAGAQSHGGGLFDEPVLVVNQKAKLIEVNNEYAIYDADGHQLGAVRQVGQSAVRKVLRVLTEVDQFLTHKLELVDTRGDVQLRITRPAKVIKSKVLVEAADGRPIGTLAQQNAIGKIRFSLVDPGGVTVGSLQAENWRAWDFAILDVGGVEVARIKKTWEGIAKTMFTTADNYVVRIHRKLDDPLRSLVVAAAVSVDTALKQDSRGFS